VVVGLGNPGERYAGTRHNVGFMVVDALARQLGVSFKKKLFHSYWVGKATHQGGTLYLVKPLTFMNESGRAVRDALRDSGCSVSDLVVVCDTLDLSPGSLRFKQKGSSAGQKGLQSIIKAVGTEEFMRMFVGIGRPDYKGQVVSHVLSAPRSSEEGQISEAVDNASRAVLMLASEGPARVMNVFNRKEPSP
jgi:PTH1 family peptidyl-tRNA hydrolase